MDKGDRDIGRMRRGDERGRFFILIDLHKTSHNRDRSDFFAKMADIALFSAVSSQVFRRPQSRERKRATTYTIEMAFLFVLFIRVCEVKLSLTLRHEKAISFCDSLDK